jgi:hypothetical protein
MPAIAEVITWRRAAVECSVRSDDNHQSRLASDFADLNFDVLLAMASSTLAVFSSTKLLNEDFVTLGFANHFGCHGSAVDSWLAKLKTIFATDGQNAIEFKLFARGNFAEIDF